MTGDIDELSAKARRGTLTPAERRELELALRCSVDARLTHTAGLELDAEAKVLPGDDEICQRITERLALGESSKKFPAGAFSKLKSRKLLFRAPAAGSLVVLGAASAAAGVLAFERISSPSQAVEAPMMASASQLASANVPKTDVQPRLLPEPAEPDEGVQVAHGAAVSPDSNHAISSPQQPNEPANRTNEQAAARSPGELFARCNAARRNGDGKGALRCYQELAEQHPRSQEALVARMNSARLLQSVGQHAAAERDYHAYLLAAPSGRLAPEARFGRIQALRNLGHHSEATQEMRVLIREYPGSAYAGLAQQLLTEESVKLKPAGAGPPGRADSAGSQDERDSIRRGQNDEDSRSR